MTGIEKEKIVNGIDVSECEFLECGMCNAQRNCDGYTGIECKYDNENCYYRQLKRLQEENEELKKYHKGFVANCKYCDEWYMDKCNYIKKDNKYKQALENIQTYINQECKNKQCPQTCANCLIGNVLIKVNEVLKCQ